MLKCTRSALDCGSPSTMQARYRIELPADVEPERTDRRVVAQAGADVVAQVVQVEVPGIGPDVAPVDEQHAAEVACERKPEFGREVQEGVAADRQSHPP